MKAIPLGGTASALSRAQKYADMLVASGKYTGSYIGELAAKRCCNPDDIQAFSAIVSGQPGSGKSISCLDMCESCGIEFAKWLGGSPKTYFDPEKHVLALANPIDTINFLEQTPDQRVILLDDSSVAYGNHDWGKQSSKSFIRVLTVARTKRWALFFNAPLSKMLDIGIRDLTNATFTIQYSAHSHGFNILNGYWNLLTSTGESYKARFKDDNGKKINYFIAKKPSADILRRYNEVRKKSSDELLKREKEALNVETTKKPDLKEVRIEKCIKILKENPDIGRVDLEMALGVSHDLAAKTKKEALKRMEVMQ